MGTPDQFKPWGETRRENKKKNIFYVYMHVDPDTKEIVYIGKGCFARAANVDGRTDDHREWLQEVVTRGDIPYSYIYFLRCDLPEEDAYFYEQSKLSELIDAGNRPRFNKVTRHWYFAPDYPAHAYVKAERERCEYNAKHKKYRVELAASDVFGQQVRRKRLEELRAELAR